MTHITHITATTTPDSRGEETVACVLTLSNGADVSASVPQGKSTGIHEAVSIPARDAVRAIEEVVVPALVGKPVHDIRAIDAILIELGGAGKKETGANATLAVSIAVARAGARVFDEPLWKFLRRFLPYTPHARPRSANEQESTFPKPFVNVINGGLHAGGNIPFQEYIVIPQESTMQKSLAVAEDMYRAVGTLVREHDADCPLGDEGGYAPIVNDPLLPFALIREASENSGLDVTLGLDAAGTDVALSDEEKTLWYEKMVEEYGLFYLEDPYAEDGFSDFKGIHDRYGDRVIIAGDDLTTTNVERMREAHEKGSVNGVILKPNQIGTVSEALDAAALAHEYGWYTVASHRSGETRDDFIADFAYAVGASGIKIGAPAQPERLTKYARLRAIEKEMDA